MNPIDRHPHRRAAIAVTLVVIMLGVGAASAQYERPRGGYDRWLPAQPTTPTLSLMEALRLAIDYDPSVALARESSLLQKGSARQSTGIFDGLFILDTSFEHSRGELIANLIRQQEGQRNLFRILSTEADRVADDLLRRLDEGDGAVFVNCDDLGTDIILGGQPICISGREAANAQMILDLYENFGVDALRDALIEVSRREAANLAQALQIVAFRSREALRELGLVPTVEEETTLFAQVSYSKPFRNGWMLTPAIGFEGIKDNFEHKTQKAGVPDKFTLGIGLTLNIPLGKGGSRVSAQAPEKASRLNYDASLETEAHTVSQSVLRGLLQYWSLVSAQERVELFETIAERYEQLFGLAEGLVEAEEIASSDLEQVRGRLADTYASVAQGRQAVVQSRLRLAQAIGIDVDRLEEAPLASDSFPPPPDQNVVNEWKTKKLSQVAVANRNDLGAARVLEESSIVLANAARWDLKRAWDLEIAVGYSGLAEGGSVTRGVDVVDGIYRSLFGIMAGPSARVVLNVEWPFKNNVAIGRYAQSTSTARKSSINAIDLERVIVDNTQDLLGQLIKSVDEIARREQSVAFYNDAISQEVEKYQLGEATIIDVILTQDRQTSALLSLLAARQTYASLLARLRFELGTLVSGRVEDGQVIIEEIDATGFEFPERSS